jgi:hypothetical protein
MRAFDDRDESLRGDASSRKEVDILIEWLLLLVLCVRHYDNLIVMIARCEYYNICDINLCSTSDVKLQKREMQLPDVKCEPWRCRNARCTCGSANFLTNLARPQPPWLTPYDVDKVRMMQRSGTPVHFLGLYPCCRRTPPPSSPTLPGSRRSNNQCACDLGCRYAISRQVWRWLSFRFGRAGKRRWLEVGVVAGGIDVVSVTLIARMAHRMNLGTVPDRTIEDDGLSISSLSYGHIADPTWKLRTFELLSDSPDHFGYLHDALPHYLYMGL